MVAFVTQQANTGSLRFSRWGGEVKHRLTVEHQGSDGVAGHVGLPEVMCFNQPRATLDVKTLLIINWHSPQSAVTFKNALCVQNRGVWCRCGK